ncbi:hypothetical protein DRQ53_13270 [bacterium]|nr:MAG: hypothetical protein DRQ53_13270 [bacterium]
MATRNSKIYIPASSADDWQQFLADPAKQWKTGYSARTMAYSWQEANGIPDEVQGVLSQDEALRKMEALLVIPEHQVPLPGVVSLIISPAIFQFNLRQFRCAFPH